MGENGMRELTVLTVISKLGNYKKTCNHLCVFSIFVIVALE